MNVSHSTLARKHKHAQARAQSRKLTQNSFESSRLMLFIVFMFFFHVV